MQVVTVRDVRMVRRFSMVSLGMVFGGQLVMLGRVFVVLGGAVMMIRDRMGLRHTFLLVEKTAPPQSSPHTKCGFVTVALPRCYFSVYACKLS